MNAKVITEKLWSESGKPKAGPKRTDSDAEGDSRKQSQKVKAERNNPRAMVLKAVKARSRGAQDFCLVSIGLNTTRTGAMARREPIATSKW